MHREASGAVLISAMKCIGCGLCTLACPFGSVRLDALNKIARKCDLCAHRTEIGLKPACVTTCSARALTYGEFETLLASAQRRKGRTVVNRAAGNIGTLVTLPAGWDGEALRSEREVNHVG
jgi:formate dehydrogenase iron-sulfur subunit